MSKQYPAQTGEYVVKVKSGQSTHAWQDFEKVRAQISVGQSYHEGAKLQAMVDWARYRFDELIVCANDALQRFNIMFEEEIEEEEAEAKAIDLGAAWLERAMPVIEGVTRARVMRWEDWKLRAEFQASHDAVEWLYHHNTDFRSAIDENIEAVWSRREREDPERYTAVRKEEFQDLSRRYLLEETAVFAQMFEDEEEAIDIYPGTVLFPVVVFQGKEVAGAPAGFGKGKFCRIDFSRNRSWNPL